MSQQPGSGPYPPQGVPPQQPQQPPYGGGPYPGAAPQPLYGQQPPYTPPPGAGQQPPYQPPQPGYGQQQPPFSQQTYGAPQGQPGQNPYGQANAAWSPPGGVPPQPPKKKSHVGVIVAVVVIVVVVAIVLVLTVAGGVAMWVNQAQPAVKTGVAVSTGPDPSITKATTATKASVGPAGTVDVTCSGTTIDSSAFTAKVPSGWSCASQSISLILTDKKFDTLMVTDIVGTSDAAAACTSLANAGPVTALPDTQWGGKTAKTVSMDSGGSKVHVRCVSVNDSVYYLMGIPVSGMDDEVVAGADALTSGWTWK